MWIQTLCSTRKTPVPCTGRAVGRNGVGGPWALEGLAWVRLNTDPAVQPHVHAVPTPVGQPYCRSWGASRSGVGPFASALSQAGSTYPAGTGECAGPHTAIGAAGLCPGSRPLCKPDEDWNLLPPKRTDQVLCQVRRFPDSVPDSEVHRSADGHLLWALLGLNEAVKRREGTVPPAFDRKRSRGSQGTSLV